MNLTDVETLGATSAINTDKTGTLTMNQMMVSTIYSGGSWFAVEGAGYRKSGAILSVAGTPVPDFSRLALGLVLDSDATVAEDGSVVGDPTEAALVVLSAKLGVDAEETRRAHPRIAEVPFDSEYTFMATFHHVPDDPTGQIIELVKGGPDVVLARCTMSGGPLSGSQVPIEQVCGSIVAANAGMGEKGLRVMAFAARLVDDDETWAMTDDPMSLTHELALVGMVGIIDPLQAEAKAAVQTALHAGIDVRMITGDHAVTAKAIGETLGLGPGAISGSQLQAMSDGTAVLFWILYGAVLFVAALVPLVAGPDAPSVNRPSASLTMTFVVMGLGTVFNALTNRRDPTSGLTAPILQALAISLAPVAMIVLATQLPGLQAALLTTSLSGLQWLECVGLALLLPLVVEVSKWIRRRRAPAAPMVDVEHAVTPGRDIAAATR